ncbi:MAG: para-nitrobenzyl esterase [Candidatus Azotimanducaceae bacterium]|jgi:para-nitrobenzyl esterase
MNMIAETKQGQVEGKLKNDVLLFAGIPFAASPTGERRFKAPAPHEPWSGVRAATRFGKPAPQVATGGMTDSVPVAWDEDCLYLNVQTPAIDEDSRPVLFWIHGGGFRTGQGAIPWYDGAQFVRNGNVVVVSINYRLGALGFTDLSRFGSEYETSGANGILDQLFALQWVKDNIQNFGGDPDNVTIAGESAGAFSVCSLLASPLSKGLFKRAISQSGSAHHALTKDAAGLVTDALLEVTGCKNPAELQEISVDDILKHQTSIDVQFNNAIKLNLVAPFYPAIGNSVLPALPLDCIRDGAGADVDLLIGTNKDESSLFMTQSVTEERYHKDAERFGAGTALTETYNANHPNSTTTERAIQMGTDFTFRIPSLRICEARAAGQSNDWMYRFDWESRNGPLKATHALEVPFVFDNLGKAGVGVFLGPGEIPQAVADKMHQSWIDFIVDGDPGWAKYDLEKRTNMRFDTSSQIVLDPDLKIHKVWQGIR